MKNSHIVLYKVAAINVLVIGFILAIILGDTYSIQNEINANIEYKFNTVVFFSAWAVSAITSILIYGIYSACYRLDYLIKINPNYKKDKANKK